MRTKIVGVLIIGLLTFECHKDEIDLSSLSGSKGLSLYWNHQIFGEKGRGFIFEFYEAERFENSYELVFECKIDNKRKNIDIYLVDKIDKGKCPIFPMPDKSDNLCQSNGDFFIPENMLEEGDYNFTVRTSDFKVRSGFTIKKDQVTLNIPENEYFSSSVKEVFPTPRDLLYGNIIFTGEDKTVSAHEFFTKLKALGLKDTIVSNPPFNLSVDETGKPKDSHWPLDEHSLAFLYSMNVSFQKIFDLSKVYFNNHDLNIYLFSSNGDQAFLSKVDGIVVEYAH